MGEQGLFQRRAGMLLHPTSLPSSCLDGDAERWLDLLYETGFSIWQVLPLGEPQDGLSPYQCVSAFALNPLLINEYPEVNYELDEFVEFCDGREWLDDYVLFKVLKNKFDGAPWYDWPDEYKYRHSHALLQSAEEYENVISVLKWQQYQLFNRWFHIKKYASRKNILLFGDMPLFVAHDSADVWAAPERFLLNKSGMMDVVAGVPPDYFSDTGQRWGNPHYDWDFMRNEHYAWWMSRIGEHFEMFDLLRIDHFRGLESAWVINSSCDTAVDGYWKKMPGDELLSQIEIDHGKLPIVAEDLGIITREVTALRKKHELPGMAVIQFSFDEHDDNPHKVKNILKDCAVYTGTHDNNTTRGWFESLDEKTRNIVLNEVGAGGNNLEICEIVDRIIDMAMTSRASICIIPMQDFICLDGGSRMNTPGTIEGNWQWAFEWSQVDSTMIRNMRKSINESGRMVKHE